MFQVVTITLILAQVTEESYIGYVFTGVSLSDVSSSKRQTFPTYLLQRTLERLDALDRYYVSRQLIVNCDGPKTDRRFCLTKRQMRPTTWHIILVVLDKRRGQRAWEL